MTNNPENPENHLNQIKKRLEGYERSNKNDAKIIKDIRKELIDNKRKQILTDYKNNLKSDISTLRSHQKFTNIAVNPFIKINGETIVPNHELIMIDPFVSLNDQPLKKNFDALILNQEEKFNTLIFIETKTSKLTERLLNQIIEKIQNYETKDMQDFIREELKPLKIDRIEYVLLIKPHRNDLARRFLHNKEIKIINTHAEKKKIKVPLIIWNFHPSTDTEKANYHYLMIQPYNNDTNEAIKLRQHHQNQNLIKFLSNNIEYELIPSLISLKFSPVLNITYQLIMFVTEFLKLYDRQSFNRTNLVELIEEQLFPNLRKDENTNFIYQRIIRKGLNSKIFFKTEEIDEYRIRMRRIIQPIKIQEEILNKICAYKTDKEYNSVETQLELNKKLLDLYILSKDRTTMTLNDFGINKK